MTNTYPFPAGTAEVATEAKKSRFIARAAKVRDRQEVQAFIDQARCDYPDARHHCWAYVLGNPLSAISAAQNDDGEPSGTAGKPILNVIQHKGVGDVVVVVIRYFGGIKLGAGGLVRAYSGAAEAVMSILPVEQSIAMQHVTLTMDFSREQLLRHWLEQSQGKLGEVEYSDKVVMEMSVPNNKMEELSEFCAAHNVSLEV